MTDSVPLRIFLASPGDLGEERAIVESCVKEYSARSNGENSENFEVVGWEQVRGTARRPQEAINELIHESHFLIVLFKELWGSEPGSPWGYTSGTEEELFTGLLELGQADQPMRDVWVAFVNHPSPAPQVVALQSQMAQSHSVMYESIVNSRDLKDKLTKRLEGWAESAEFKAPRNIDLLSSSGKDVLKAARLRLKGEKLIELGQTSAGRDALKEAAILGGPVEQLAYAKFLTRQGDLEEASALTETAIGHFISDTFPLYSPLAAEAFADKAGILRRQGRDVDAIGRLEHALTLLHEHDPYTENARCRILDFLGHAYRKTGNLILAREYFQKAFDYRQKTEKDLEKFQSLINLARIELEDDNVEVADEYMDQVIEGLQQTPPTALHANGHALAAEIRLRQGRASEGISYAQRALSLNRQLSNKYGEAISLYILAECYREAGKESEAKKYAHECLELNQLMENEFGSQQAQGVIDRLGIQ